MKEKEESSKPQTHLHPNPPPPLDFTEAGNIPNPGMNQESFLQCSQVMLQGLADKGFIHAKSPKFDLFFGMKDKNKIEFDMWERQVLAAATDHSDTAIRQAMLQSLKGQALMVTTTLPPLVVMSNYSDQDITIPAKTIISQLSLGSKVPKNIYPGDDKDSELFDNDEGLKYEHFEQHKLISEELNLEPEEYIPTSV